MSKLRVGVVFGGTGEENFVSVRSAQQVAMSLDPSKYEPVWIGITKSGAWRLCDGPDPGWEQRGGRPAMLCPDRTIKGLLVLGHGTYHVIGLDVVLPVVHGTLGEDGALQGLFELAGIPYAGCGVASSALCMDKSLTYAIAASAGIATPVYRTVESGTRPEVGGLTYPVFVKPARSGSSFGVSKVQRKEDLLPAVQHARAYDTKVLIEEAVTGSEVGCAIVGNGSDLTMGEIDRIVLTQGFFRIHQEPKPESGSENSRIIVPADISKHSRARVRETATAIYRAVGCKGLARVDMFLKEDGTVVLNEVNTLPGLTSYSRYPRMMAAAGLTLAEVLDQVLALAMGGEDL